MNVVQYNLSQQSKNELKELSLTITAKMNDEMYKLEKAKNKECEKEKADATLAMTQTFDGQTAIMKTNLKLQCDAEKQELLSKATDQCE